MHYVFVSSSEPDNVLDMPANAGYNAAKVLACLQELADAGHTFSALSPPEDERETLYFAAASQAARLRIQVSRVFGSRRLSGAGGFGREVPALLVYESEHGTLLDIYRQTHKHDPVDTTILDYLCTAA